MILYIVRHGEPDYPAKGERSLTPLGHRQAAAAAEVLAKEGVDAVYASPLDRAQMTAKYTAEKLNLPIITADFVSEDFSWQYFAPVGTDGNKHWMFERFQKERYGLYHQNILDAGFEWYDQPAFADGDFKEGYLKLADASDAFFAGLGYRHDREHHFYIPEAPNDQKIAVFCHGGMGSVWTPALLDIPLPTFWRTVDCMNFTAITKIDFEIVCPGICIPRIQCFGDYAHIRGIGNE